MQDQKELAAVRAMWARLEKRALAALRVAREKEARAQRLLVEAAQLRGEL